MNKHKNGFSVDPKHQNQDGDKFFEFANNINKSEINISSFLVDNFVMLYVVRLVCENMPITYEKIEFMLEEKLEKSLQPFIKQLEEATKAIQFTSVKYDEIIKLLKINEEEKKQLLLRIKVLVLNF